jgi:hypothetical protein
LPEPTPKQEAVYTDIRKELKKVRGQYRMLTEKLYGKDPERTKEQFKQMEKELEEIHTRMTEPRSKLPVESERHGWVWLFMRKEIQNNSFD